MATDAGLLSCMGLIVFGWHMLRARERLLVGKEVHNGVVFEAHQNTLFTLIYVPALMVNDSSGSVRLVSESFIKM